MFRSSDSADSEAVVRLADYTRRELLSLLEQPREDVFRGWVAWGPCVGETAADRLDRQRRMLEGEWREALHVDGRVYFYHTTTHETSWVPPADGLYARRRFALARHLAAAADGDDAAGAGGRVTGGAAAAAALPPPPPPKQPQQRA